MTCTANKKDGKPCRGQALAGRDVCHAHSGARVGRPAALTPEVCERIVQLVKAGCRGELAAQTAGISATTFYATTRRGREAESGPDRELVEALERARAEAYGHAMIALRRDIGTPGNWRAALAYIDRFDRGRFPLTGSPGGSSEGGAGHAGQRLDLSALSEEKLAYLEALYADEEDDDR